MKHWNEIIAEAETSAMASKTTQKPAAMPPAFVATQKEVEAPPCGRYERGTRTNYGTHV